MFSHLLSGAGSELPAFVDSRSTVADLTWSDMILNRNNSNWSKKYAPHASLDCLPAGKHFPLAQKLPNSGCLGHFSAFSRSCMPSLFSGVNQDDRDQCYLKGHPSATASITHLLSHILATLQVMVTVWKDFRLHNWHNAMLRGREA